MSLMRHLVSFEPDELAEVYRYWAGEIGVPTTDENLVKNELQRLMTDRDRVTLRFKELPTKCRDFIEWMVEQEGFAVPLSQFDADDGDLPIKGFEVEAVAFALKKRGFLIETRDLSWVNYNEPVYVVPEDLAEVLACHLGSGERTLESQLLLRVFLRTLKKEEIVRRLELLGHDPALVDDRSKLIQELAKPESLEKALVALEDKTMRGAAERVLYDHGGIGEKRHLERLFGGKVVDPDSWREALEECLLGTVTHGDLTDVGLQMGAGSVVVFLDLVRAHLLPKTEVQPEEEPEPPADVLADIAAIRTFLDHHSVRVTRDGTLYRTTRRKMESELLSPGARPVDSEEALTFILRFLSDAELISSDRDGRMRTTDAWDDFDLRGPVDRADLLLTYVQNDLRETKGAFHQPRLRKLFLSVLREAGPSRWLALRPLAILARNRYLQTLDRGTVADRFQKRYKYAPIPPLAVPAVLTRELVRFGSEHLSIAGVVEVLEVEDQSAAIRLTRLGAALLGFAVEEPAADEDGALIVTADFEIVLFPEAGGIELIHEVSKFSRREKADYSLHYRIQERTVQEAVAGGMTAEQILESLRRHGRHEIPQNVESSIVSWAKQVLVLKARRTLLIQAPSKKALDAAMKVREFKAIAGERLNELVIELSEDPSTPRVAEALRAQGFFLR